MSKSDRQKRTTTGADADSAPNPGEILRLRLENDRLNARLAEAADERENYRRRYRQFLDVFEKTDASVFIGDEHGFPIMFNTQYAQLMQNAFGIEIRPGIKPHQLIPDPTIREWWAGLHRRVLTGESFQAEYSHCFPDGNWREFEFFYTPVGLDGGIAGFAESIRDITTRKHAEQTLRESEERYRVLVDSTPMGIVVHCNGKVVFANARAAALMAAPSADMLLGGRVMDFIAHEHRMMVENRIARIYHEREPQGVAIERFIRLDGKTIDVEVAGAPVNFQGNPASLVAFSDISKRIEAEKINYVLKEIAHSADIHTSLERLYRSIQRILGTAMDTRNFYVAMVDKQRERLHFPYHADEKGDYFTSLPVDDAASLTAYVFRTGQSVMIDREEAQQLCRTDEDREDVYGPYAKIWLGVPLKIHNQVSGVIAVQSYDNSDQYCEQDKVLLEAASGVIARAIERKQAEVDLRESEARFRAIFQTNPDAIVILRMADRRVVNINESFSTLSGYSASNIIDGFFPPEGMFCDKNDGESLLAEIREKAFILNRECDFRRPDGGRWSGLLAAKLLLVNGETHVLVNIRDISAACKAEEEKNQLQERLLQAQKMEAVGVLAGGLAHDFNNILMGIQGRVSLMLLDADNRHPFYGHLRGIQEYIRHASDITRQLLSFSRSGKYEARSVDLNELAREQIGMFAGTAREISIHERLEPTVWSVEADAGQIRQAVLNLLMNARQAMPSGGDIRVTTQNVELDENRARLNQAAPGSYVALMVSDTGVGMDDKTISRIFEPFFTTKELGRGAGLGLASVYSIVKNHGGFITVDSAPGKGSCFTVFLPAARMAAKMDDNSECPCSVSRGNETILVIDDEAFIIEVSAELLKALGYRVLTANNGMEGLEVFKKHIKTVDLVILDMVMPRMGGKETLALLKEIKPDIRVLIASGYSLEAQSEKFRELGCSGFIQKPYDLTGLGIKIREVLGN